MDQCKCSGCDFRITIRSGTVMQDSNSGLYQYYLAMAFMSFSKNGISASELQRQMGISYYCSWKLGVCLMGST